MPLSLAIKIMQLYKSILRLALSHDLSESLLIQNEQLIKVTKDALNYIFESTYRVFKHAASDHSVLLNMETSSKIDLSMKHQVIFFCLYDVPLNPASDQIKKYVAVQKIPKFCSQSPRTI